MFDTGRATLIAVADASDGESRAAAARRRPPPVTPRMRDKAARCCGVAVLSSCLIACLIRMVPISSAPATAAAATIPSMLCC